MFGGDKWSSKYSSVNVSGFTVVARVSASFTEGIKFIKPEEIVILSDRKIYPIDMMSEIEKYPKDEDIINLLNRQKVKLIQMKAAEIAEEIKFPKAENIILLGVLAEIISLDKVVLIKVLK